MWHVVLLVVCAVAIYLSCEWFVNAVEWLGLRLNLGRMAVGTVLAAFGTALPESVVTLVAVTTGRSEAMRDVGVGAALGGPLALSTIAYGVTGVVLLRHRRTLRREAIAAGPGTTGPVTDVHHQVLEDETERRRLVKDQTWFLPIFVVKVALGLVAFAYKPLLGLLFFGVYAIYFWRELNSDTEDGIEHEELEPLKLRPGADRPATWAVALQTLGSLAVIFVASQLFVNQLDAIGPMIGLSGATTALLLSPIATELPETMNAIIWVRQGKTRLALANISGAMMIQATVPSGLGLLFTTWHFDGPLLWSGVVTLLAILYLMACMRTMRLTPVRLALAAGFYAVFAIGLIPVLS